VVIDTKYTEKIEEFCDIFICKADNFNTPHGMGELIQTQLGISIIEYYGFDFFTKLNYDYWMDYDIYRKYLEWKNTIQTKEIVSSEWRADGDDMVMMESMACGFGVYKTQAAKKLFDFNHFTYPIETVLYRRSRELFKSEEVYLYNHFESAFGGGPFDIFNDGGNAFSQKRLSRTFEIKK
jgi:hypothetical protein